MTAPRIFIAVTFFVCFSVYAQAQTVPCSTWNKLPQAAAGVFPNELEELKFFGEGKLKSLKFWISGIDDVRSIFGTPIQKKPASEVYDYSSDWLIMFGYLDSKSPVKGTGLYDNDVFGSKKLIPKPEYEGKIYYVKIFPKKSFPFNETDYRKTSNIKAQRSADFYYTYSDPDGLTYKVFDRKVGSFVSEFTKEKLTLSQGDIMEIQYIYPCSIDKGIYIEEKRR